MKWKGAGTTKGIIKDQTFTMDNHGMIFVYTRSDQVKNTERTAMKAQINAQKAWAGVFDDFNSGLINGWDSDRNPIGFFTFSDSTNSIVRISTTSDHPQLPGESDNNEVLKLDLDINAWGGIIHNFENAAVDVWTPRDWRGFKSISFWLYGQNSNSALFIEILDNRNPNSESGGAEVYSHSFTDNFSGWKLINIPFNEFFRKEIGNDAPNDGLSLSEVHGWAFGTLDTRGPIIYYLDDLSLQ
ncbi:MAG: carbohydrate binding domain-containing protein [Gammaproteobacteria bacterium]|nr:carbohydrate binding domain-containing protein [Gammaproteobacteria bacterium]